jgi:hypothetical protein
MQLHMKAVQVKTKRQREESVCGGEANAQKVARRSLQGDGHFTSPRKGNKRRRGQRDDNAYLSEGSEKNARRKQKLLGSLSESVQTP